MTKEDFKIYLASDKTNVINKNVGLWINSMKKIIMELTGDNSDDPFQSITTLKQLEQLLKSSKSPLLLKYIQEGNGRGGGAVKHFADKLKLDNGSDPDNQDFYKDKIKELIKKYTKEGQNINTIDNQSNMTLQSDNNDLNTDISELLLASHNIVLHGAPGTGKTFLAKQIAQALGCTAENGTVKMVQFHPSYDYSDFMEGLRPVDKGNSLEFERKNGAFKDFCKNAIKSTENIKYVFIIDEINRGEISKILGECMFSIDPGYLGEKGLVDTQYQNLVKEGDVFSKGFFRPENVYIIGTMNDIDRGVEAMDLAMRRRFLFIEVKAEDTQDAILNTITDDEVREIARVKMNKLNEEIRGNRELGEDYCIGAAYFQKIENYNSDDKWECLWKYHLKGLLKEYVRGLEDGDSLLKTFEKAYCAI